MLIFYGQDLLFFWYFYLSITNHMIVFTQIKDQIIKKKLSKNLKFRIEDVIALWNSYYIY